MNKNIEELLVYVFDEGLDEDAHFRYEDEWCKNYSVEDLEIALQELNKDSFEYNLLSRLIEDMKWKLEAETLQRK